MNVDDIIYMSVLFICIGSGHYYREYVDNIALKKWIGTACGLLIVFIVSGIHIIHPLLSAILNSIIIITIDKRKCHLVSFTFMFLYLFFFRCTTWFGIPSPPAHTNLIQMILTLKLVGLSFEVNESFTQKALWKKTGSDPCPYEINPSFIDMFHYGFNYIGVLTGDYSILTQYYLFRHGQIYLAEIMCAFKYNQDIIQLKRDPRRKFIISADKSLHVGTGPYFSYRTFTDYLKLPYSKVADCVGETLRKLKWVPVFCAMFLITESLWPVDYVTTDAFLTRSFLYRLWYVWPVFFTFRMRIYIGLILSECVCTMAGLGAYPTITRPKPGAGPAEDYKEKTDLASLGTVDMDFETVHNINPLRTDTCITFREAMKSWNMCVQYWLAVNIYKRFPNKKYRTAVTLLVSALWHGVYAGYYFCILGAPFYLPIEDLYDKLFRKQSSGVARQVWDGILWFNKMFAFSYMGIAFLLLKVNLVWKYYNSVYHFGYVLWIGLYLGGLLINNQRKARRNRFLASEIENNLSVGINTKKNAESEKLETEIGTIDNDSIKKDTAENDAVENINNEKDHKKVA